MRNRKCQSPADRLALMYDPQCFVTTFQAAYSGQLLQLPDLRQLVSDGKTMQPTKSERKKQGGSIKRTRVASTGEFGSKKRKGKRGATSRKHPRNKSGPSKGSDDLTWLGPTACATILDQIGALGRLLDEAEGSTGGAKLQLCDIVGSWNKLAVAVPWSVEGRRSVLELGGLLESATTAVKSSVTSLQALSESVTLAMDKLRAVVTDMSTALASATSKSTTTTTGGSSIASSSAGISTPKFNSPLYQCLVRVILFLASIR